MIPPSLYDVHLGYLIFIDNFLGLGGGGGGGLIRYKDKRAAIHSRERVRAPSRTKCGSKNFLQNPRGVRSNINNMYRRIG